MEAIVLAGGTGTRLRPVVSDVPKPMAPVGGRPFLEWLIDYWIKQGVSRFVLAIGYKYSVVQKYFGNRYKNAEISYSIEKDPLGTGGGMLLAVKGLNKSERFLVLNGDTYFEVSLAELQTLHVNHKAEWSIALFKVLRNDRYGHVIRDSQNRVVSFESKSKDFKTSFINGGVYLIEPNALSYFDLSEDKAVSLESEMLPQMIQKRCLYGFDFNQKFIDIGIPEDYRKASSMLVGKS